MLAVARILRTGAKLLLLDEISEGLAPVIATSQTVTEPLMRPGQPEVLTPPPTAPAATAFDMQRFMAGDPSGTPVPGRPVSTGVGLANIRNRLAQAYGDTHLFETRSEAGGGFTVLIEIPFTRADVPEPAKAAPAAAVAASDNIIPLNPPQRIIGSPL